MFREREKKGVNLFLFKWRDSTDTLSFYATTISTELYQRSRSEVDAAVAV